MKTLFLFAALILAASTKIFANDGPVNPAVRQAFENTFGRTVSVKWSVVDHLYKADFLVAGEPTMAFFDSEGSLVASSRYLPLTDLPRTLQRSLKETAASDHITEVFEVQSDAGTDYFATLQKSGETVVLKASSVNWYVYKKN